MSILEYDYEQRSPEWHKIRNGKITGSQFKLIVQSAKPKMEWTQAHIGFLMGKAAERITGQHEIDGYISKDMEWGTDHEPAAMAAVNEALGLNFRECGYFENTRFPGCGSSPDGIEDEKKMSLEIKCPASKTHLKYLRDSSEIWKDYKYQCLGELLIPETKSLVLCSYDPRFPPDSRLVIFKPKDYEPEFLSLASRLIAANEMIKGLMV